MIFFFFFNYTECLSLWPALLIFPRNKNKQTMTTTRTRMRTPSLGRTYQFSIFIRNSDDVTWYFTVWFQQRTRVCECICELHSTTNMILCVCYETIAHATSRHMPPYLHAWPCQGVIIVNTRISNCFCSASRGICVCVFVIRARL